MKKQIISILVSIALAATAMPISLAENTDTVTGSDVKDIQNLDDSFLEDTFQEAVDIIQNNESEFYNTHDGFETEESVELYSDEVSIQDSRELRPYRAGNSDNVDTYYADEYFQGTLYPETLLIGGRDVYYSLMGKCDTVSFSTGCRDTSEYGGAIDVFGDGVLLKSIPRQGKDEGIMRITLDVKGINTLKIVGKESYASVFSVSAEYDGNLEIEKPTGTILNNVSGLEAENEIFMGEEFPETYKVGGLEILWTDCEEFSSISFLTGVRDNQINGGALSVYADDKLVYEIPSQVIDDGLKLYKISTNNAKNVKIVSLESSASVIMPRFGSNKNAEGYIYPDSISDKYYNKLDDVSYVDFYGGPLGDGNESLVDVDECFFGSEKDNYYVSIASGSYITFKFNNPVAVTDNSAIILKTDGNNNEKADVYVRTSQKEDFQYVSTVCETTEKHIIPLKDIESPVMEVKIEGKDEDGGSPGFDLVDLCILSNSSVDYSSIINSYNDWKYNSSDTQDEEEENKNNSLNLNNNSFESFDSGKDTLRGPKIKILNKSFYLFELPINMSLKTPIGSVSYNSKSEKFEVMLGKLDKTALANVNEKNKTYHELKEFINYCGKKTTSDTWNKYQHLRKVLKESNIDLGFSFNATPAGYMELDKNGKFLEGSIVYVLNMDINMKNPIPAAPIIYIKVGLGIDAMGKFGIKSIDTNAYSVFGSLGLDVAPYVGAGAGNAKLVNAEVGAKLTLSTKLELIKNKKLSEIFSADATGTLYFKLKALAFINFEKKFDIAKMSLYPDFGADLMSIELAGYDDMVVMPRDYMDEESVFTANDNISVMSIDKIETSVFKTNIYPNAEPQLIKLNDGREMLVWIDNDVSRSDINCSVLKFSINNGTSWSQPADVYNSGTADFAPAIAVTENGAALVWQKSNAVLSDSATLTEMAQQMDLYYSEFDGTGWSAPIKLTDENTVYEFAPDIASDGTNITVAWVENSENDCFALSGTNTIYTKTSADNWTETTAAVSDLGNVTSVGITYMGGAPTVAYTVDMDGDTETSGDVELYEYCGGEVSRITEDEVIDYGLTMGSKGYSWIHNDQLWERTVAGVSLMEIPIMPHYLSNVHFMSNGEDRAIVWEQINEFTSDLYAMYYDNDDKAWGEPVKLTEDNKKIRESSGYMTSDGTIRMAFGQAEVNEDSEDVYGRCDLMVSNIREKCDVEVVSADCEYINYVPGEEAVICATVKNNSSSKINKFDVTVTSGGTTVAETQVEKEIISGGIDYIEIPYILPSDLSNKTLAVTVTPAEKTYDDLSNNSTSFEMGFSDLVTTVSVDGNTITATIKNSGCLSAENVMCTLSESDGTVIEERRLNTMEAGAAEQIEFTVNNSDRVIISVTTDSNENLYSNNDAAVSLTEYENKGVYIALSEYEIEGDKMTVNSTVVNDSENEEDVEVIIASYNGDTLNEVVTDTVRLSANGTEKITKDFDPNVDTVKVFIWDSISGMRPYNSTVSIDII